MARSLTITVFDSDVTKTDFDVFAQSIENQCIHMFDDVDVEINGDN